MSKDIEDGLAEKELEYFQLTEQLRLVQSDRQNYIDEMQKRIRLLKNEIKLLEDEQSDLFIKLSNVNSQANQKKDERDTEDLANLADNKEWLEQQIEEEKAKQAELDSKIRILCATRQKQKGDSAADKSNEDMKEFNLKTQKKITTLHDRLQNGLRHYNELLSSNASLREEIDTLRCERYRYDDIYKKLDLQLTKIRRETTQLIQEACQAYAQREDANSKMHAMKEKMDRDLAVHNAEMKELVRIIDYERKLKAFMDIKGKEREEDPQFTAYKAKRAKEAEEKKAAEETSQEAYVLAFAHIFELIGSTKLKDVLPIFLEREDRIFALYNYINELNSEYDSYKLEVSELRDKISDMSAITVNESKTLEDELKVREENKVTVVKETSGMAHQVEVKKQALNKVMEQVGALFTKMNCDRSALDCKLAHPDSVTEENILDYLRIIEQRLNYLLVVYNYIADNDPDFKFTQCNPILGFNAKKDIEIPGFYPPNIMEDFEDDIIEPMSREDISQKVVKLVQKKELQTIERPVGCTLIT